MNCCVTDLRCKEVINKDTGCRLGPIWDVEVDSCCGRVVAVIILGRPRYFGVLGKRECIRVCWENIDVIGEDTVLVTCVPEPVPPMRPHERGFRRRS